MFMTGRVVLIMSSCHDKDTDRIWCICLSRCHNRQTICIKNVI